MPPKAASEVELAAAENGFAVPPELAEKACEWLADAWLKEGAWGAMEGKTWRTYLEWLHESGVLTTAVNSRNRDGKAAASLDELRAGDAGGLIHPDAVPSLFSNDYLPNP
jgi:hypothetical protein